MDKPPIEIPDGPWPFGVDSVSDPLTVPPGHARWAVNAINKGGHWKSRPGYSILFDSSNSSGEPRGLAMFYPKNSSPTLVKAVGARLRYAPYPFTNWQTLPDIIMSSTDEPVHMTQCIMGAETQFDGSLKKLPESYPILIVQDGLTRAWSWDGSFRVQLDPDPLYLNQTPIGRFGVWAGNRYWVAQGNKLFASNILEPIKFTESNNGVASGGYFVLPDIITGIAKTADEKSLIVFTATTTTSFMINLPRDQWTATPGFQTEILPNIGCISHRSIISQYGMLWWYSRGGWINLDSALSSYRSSRVHYKDNNMMRSKANMADDKSRICAGSFDNYTMVSVPSGDIHNAHTWVMDQMPNESDASTLNPIWLGVWTGIRPVQWVTAEVNGKSRIFALSRDKVSVNAFTSQVWEAFTLSPVDIGNDGEAEFFSPIPASFETRYLTEGPTLKVWGYARALVSELRDTVNHQWLYATRHSAFLEILTKQTVATTESVDYRALNVGPASQVFFPQVRELWSQANQPRVADGDTGRVESEHTRNKDRGFFLQVNWTGRAAYNQITLFAHLRDDQPRGKVEDDEDTDRYITLDGATAVAATAPVPPTISQRSRESAYVLTSVSRVREVEYAILA